MEIADKSIEFAEKTNITYSLAYAYCFKAQALSGMQNDKEAAKAYVKAFKISKKQKAILIQSYVEHIYEAYVEQKFLSRTSNFYN
ncbi:hypothetical protein [Aquimarina aquimarini]|uniref:hypothetical protein n=1 Tax=Aquimarina aquimarini TaxID=1191734 RepID=UPI001F3BA7F6|nr:hypothetical protein [Aquimarina aquimarini]